MKRNWELDELIEHFTLMPQEMRLVGNKAGETRLGFSVILKYFQHEGRFPNHRIEVPNTVVEFIAKQIESAAVPICSRYMIGLAALHHITVPRLENSAGSEKPH